MKAKSDGSFFVDSVEEDRESDMDVAEGAEILKTLRAAFESS